MNCLSRKHILLVQHMLCCVLFCLFPLSSSCVPNVSRFSGLSILNAPMVFSNVYLRMVRVAQSVSCLAFCLSVFFSIALFTIIVYDSDIYSFLFHLWYFQTFIFDSPSISILNVKDNQVQTYYVYVMPYVLYVECSNPVIQVNNIPYFV